MLNLIFRQIGLKSYISVVNAMKLFTKFRNFFTFDEIWFAQHFNIYTQNNNKKKNYMLTLNNVDIIYSNRGGDFTYHAPGQQIIYFLLDLNRRNFTLRMFICFLEKLIISVLSIFFIKSHSCYDAPGVYVSTKKICSIGLRISHGCSFYGLSLNVNMNLLPFKYINPCGYFNLCMTQMNDFFFNININYVIPILINRFIKLLV